MGKAIALSLAQEGAQLVLCARNEESLDAVSAEARALTKSPVHTFVCDLTVVAEREELITFARNRMDGVDILIHNVGGPKTTSVMTTTYGDWLEGFERLFAPVAHLNDAFLPVMITKGWGRIVAVTSLSVIEPIAGLAISNAMRSAVTSMLKTLADEVARDGITVNCVAPGLIETARLENLMKSRMEQSGQTSEEYMADYMRAVPAGRLGTPEEFAAAVTFLCSEQASYITGSTMCVDGGKRRSTY